MMLAINGAGNMVTLVSLTTNRGRVTGPMKGDTPMATRATDKREAEVMIRNATSVKIPFTIPNMGATWVKVAKMEARKIINVAYERDHPELVVTEYGDSVFMRPKNVDIMGPESVEHAEQQ